MINVEKSGILAYPTLFFNLPEESDRDFIWFGISLSPVTECIEENTLELTDIYERGRAYFREKDFGRLLKYVETGNGQCETLQGPGENGG